MTSPALQTAGGEAARGVLVQLHQPWSIRQASGGGFKGQLGMARFVGSSLLALRAYLRNETDLRCGRAAGLTRHWS